MNKSHSLKYRNHKSLSNLNNVDVFDIHVSNTLSTKNIGNVDTAITTLQNANNFNQSSFTGDIIPDTHELQDIGSQQKALQNLYSLHVLTNMIKAPNFTNSIGINNVGLITAYKSIVRATNSVDLGNSSVSFGNLYSQNEKSILFFLVIQYIFSLHIKVMF